jgi:hypothetical protein
MDRNPAFDEFTGSRDFIEMNMEPKIMKKWLTAHGIWFTERYKTDRECR